MSDNQITIKTYPDSKGSGVLHAFPHTGDNEGELITFEEVWKRFHNYGNIEEYELTRHKAIWNLLIKFRWKDGQLCYISSQDKDHVLVFFFALKNLSRQSVKKLPSSIN